MESLRLILVRILNAVALIIGVILSLRILFAFFNANPASPFVSWVYAISSILTYPFKEIFSNIDVLSTGGIIDFSAFISLLAYGIIISILIALTNSIFHSVNTAGDTHAHIH